MEEQADAVFSLVSLLKRGVSFAAYSLPGYHDLNFIVDDNISPVVSSRKFIITTWSGNKLEIIDRGNDTHSVVECSDFRPMTGQKRTTTSWEDYKAGIEKVTGLLKSTAGKVVISRRKILTCPSLGYSLIAKCIMEMFATYGNAFRAVYYTPATGAWCVCSPELLINVDKKTGEMNTVALAGTRQAGTAGMWDDKNRQEHNYVVRYICNVMKSLGITPDAHASETLTTGNIEHILTRISGNVNCRSEGVGIEDIVSALHPTPAICGYPREWAKKIIEEVERHDRECYGGYIAIDDDMRLLAHVNLRCFAFEPGCCRFWGGGGIMSESSPVTEWNEAFLKIDASLSFFQKYLQ